MRLVIAVGGNALLRKDERPEAETQRRRVLESARRIAESTRGHDVVLVHGNGPQVGMLARESASDTALETPYPLADLTAETQGLIGHWLAAGFRTADPGRLTVALVSHVTVDPPDPRADGPWKPIGPAVSKEVADAANRRWGWIFRDDGSAMRRVVLSPRPRRVLEMHAIGALLHTGCVVIAGGGGGIPVTENGDEVEAVVDKDLVAAEIALRIKADRLVILTDVPAVVAEFGTERARALEGPVPIGALRGMTFEEGSMGPKVAAACRFVEECDGVASIGALENAPGVLDVASGTHVVGAGGRSQAYYNLAAARES